MSECLSKFSCDRLLKVVCSWLKKKKFDKDKKSFNYSDIQCNKAEGGKRVYSFHIRLTVLIHNNLYVTRMTWSRRVVLHESSERVEPPIKYVMVIISVFESGDPSSILVFFKIEQVVSVSELLIKRCCDLICFAAKVWYTTCVNLTMTRVILID
ncbi:hypothetical protein BD770DRAFT_409261 [Pilaira anomala]|nr:hypothetical protein BD770DRAFT_409261 [Pilaira anomala]